MKNVPIEKGVDKLMDQYQLSRLLGADLLEALFHRFHLLNYLKEHGPIGRRGLALELRTSERAIRAEVEALRNQQLVDFSRKGIVVLDTTKDYLAKSSIDQMVKKTMTDTEKAVADQLSAAFVRIVPGDVKDMNYPLEASSQLAQVLDWILPFGSSKIAVTGGTTLANVSSGLSEKLARNRELDFIPARGGIGNSNLIQANTIAEQMAVQLNALHQSLFVPEHVSQETYESLIEEPTVKAVLKESKEAKVVLFSIGQAIPMALRRNLSQQVMSELKEGQVVGEAFGIFFNSSGEAVVKLPRIGLHLSDLDKIKYPLAIVSGREKVAPLVAFMHMVPHHHMWLVIDEEIANQILQGKPL